MLDTVAGERPLARARSAWVMGPLERNKAVRRSRLDARSSLGDPGSETLTAATLGLFRRTLKRRIRRPNEVRWRCLIHVQCANMPGGSSVRRSAGLRSAGRPRHGGEVPLRTRTLRVAWRRCMLVSLAVGAGGVGVAPAPTARSAALPYQDPTQPVAARVTDLLSRMSLDEKLGQMTQAERLAASTSDVATSRLGSVLSGGGSAPSPNTASAWADMYDGYQRAAVGTPLGIPILYGVDAVHGHSNVQGATIFPHNIGLGATRDPDLVQRIGRATAEEVSGTGIDWDFAPCLCVARNDRWGRTYESFGEAPGLVSSMTSLITGLQGSSLDAPGSVLATAKHFVGDGGTTGGKDQGDTQLSEADLRAIHLPPFRAAVARGVGSVMVSYSSWNGVKMHG